MIVKFLYTKGPNSHFPAVGYNTDKMDRNKGELMKTANFGPLQVMGQLRPQDYKDYLKMVSANNRAVKKPQFHVVISAGGKSYDKHELTEIATLWMQRMGYGKQPYLLIFHKDTQNNHLHIVSTRVTKEGKKINDSYEQIRGHQEMNIVLGIDEKHTARTDAEKALTYGFKTRAQFLMVLESMGYSHKEEEGKLQLFKFGKQQGEIDCKKIEERLGQVSQDARRKQITAWFYKYGAEHDTTLAKQHGKYQSAFSGYLKQALGIELVFHASGDKPPYGYTVIDHAERNVFKGGEIMPLKEMLGIPMGQAENAKIKVPQPTASDHRQREYYAAILKAVLHNYPDMLQGLQHQGLVLWRHGFDFYLGDAGAGVTLDTAELLDEKDYRYMVEQYSQYSENDTQRPQAYIPEPYIAPDIDDEAINGRNRRRKKMARTNQR